MRRGNAVAQHGSYPEAGAGVGGPPPPPHVADRGGEALLLGPGTVQGFRLNPNPKPSTIDTITIGLVLLRVRVLIRNNSQCSA